MSGLNYKIPEKLIYQFASEAKENWSEIEGHCETLAVLTGHWSGNNLIAHDLVFPKQKGSTSDVEDLGKLFINIL